MGAPLGAPAGSRNCKLLKVLVGERGFEPPTPWSRTRCSTRLSHSPTSLERNEHPRQTVEKRAVTTHSVVIITFALLRPSCEVSAPPLSIPSTMLQQSDRGFPIE